MCRPASSSLSVRAGSKKPQSCQPGTYYPGCVCATTKETCHFLNLRDTAVALPMCFWLGSTSSTTAFCPKDPAVFFLYQLYRLKQSSFVYLDFLQVGVAMTTVLTSYRECRCLPFFLTFFNWFVLFFLVFVIIVVVCMYKSQIWTSIEKRVRHWLDLRLASGC